MRPFVLPVLAAAIALGAVRPAGAQAEAEFVWVGAPLSEALYELAEATGLELVFALRLVEDVRVTGRYRASDDPDRALRYLLRGTGVRAERIREGQYVLIKEPLNVTVAGETEREAYTGTLDGRVVDAETGAALMGAHVWLVDLGLGDVVAYDGSFAVADLPTGRYVVRVSHVGYTPVRLELDVFPDSPRLPPTIRLQTETVESPDADVIAGPEPPGVQPGMTELGARQAAAIPYALGEADLAATLSWLPGLTRTGGASGALVVRGADPTQTRYVRDGVPLYEPWHAFGLFSAFQPEALSRVRFHRGSLPASLGGGLAAVLDVETTDALAGDTLRTLGLGAVAARAVADVPLGGETGMHIGFRRSALGALLTPGLRAEGGAWVLDPTGGDPFRRTGRPDVTFSDAALKFSRRVGRHGHVEVGGTLGTDAVRIDLPIGIGGMDYGWRTHTASARYEGLVGQTTLVTALGYQTGHSAVENRRLRLGETRTDQALVERGASLDVDHFVSLTHQLRGGIQVASREVTGKQVRPEGADDARQRVGEVAAYVMDTWRPGEGWQVQPGLRAEARVVDGRPMGLDLSPRLFARWSPDEDRLVVRAGLSRQTQAVHRVRDLVAGRYALAASRWLLSDGAVALARAWQVGAGVEWAPSDPLAFSLDVYGRRSRGLLEPVGSSIQEAGVIPADLLATHPAHAGRAAGIELATRYAVADWTLGFSGALSRAQIRPETGGEWRASAYDRPVALGLIAQRAAGPWTAALRLDVESGLTRPDGSRDGVQVRASGAVGAHTAFGGLQWTALAQATARPLGPSISRGVGEVGLPLATDARGLPGWPVVSVSARW
ncbi:TonB-dependent receptor [Rubrivirga marina]|uniref:Secretin/TonB short N-terminal domain-containing protein n=1 Tax=Rubrivirga marina TaxID=1196024 RepID=A0A271J2E8_9BACT|nr:TonB-dependent receptor [Rubrivirga marina]PAP77530.1 hypothetical protein BSZ37_14315 [Rubrivirga marina]